MENAGLILVFFLFFPYYLFFISFMFSESQEFARKKPLIAQERFIHGES
jgi:hypothetical protein